MSGHELTMLIAGAAVAGFVNGLAGFGTALFSLGFWLQVLPPPQAVALSVAVSVMTGVQGLWLVRAEIPLQARRLARFLLPALLGLPLGLYALHWIEPRPLKLLIAAIMLLYGLFFLTRGALPRFEKVTPVADICIGLCGGFLGGLAGLSGALPVMWFALRPWPRQVTRAILQPFNVAILALAALGLLIQGAYGPVAPQLAIVTVVAIGAAQAGIAVFRRIGDTHFRWLLIALMFASGAALMARELL